MRPRKTRVLLADDHAVMRDGLRVLLDTAPDFEVIDAVADGRQAVRQARALKPDIVLMDLSMPELNGVEATRLLAEREPAVKVIILSMHSSAEHVHRALAAGASGYVLKEAAAVEVLEAVRSVQSGRRYLSASLRETAPMEARREGPIDSLSSRERQVLQLVAEGRSSIEIAEIVHLSPKTVETYRSRLMRKLDLDDVPALVKFALQHGLIHFD